MILKDMNLTIVAPVHPHYDNYRGNIESGNVFRVGSYYDYEVLYLSGSLSDLLPLQIPELHLGIISALRIDLRDIPYKCIMASSADNIKNFEGNDIYEILERYYV